MSMATTIVIALVLDAIFGEPRWLWSRLPHPAVLMGRFISGLDAQLNSGSNRKLSGILTVFLLIVVSLLITSLLRLFPGSIVFETLLAAILLAQRSLADHVRDVANALRISLPEAKTAIAKIVGRDTKTMDESAVARAAIESAAENFSDGVTAPVFWFLIAGFPGLLIYKFINTADSMIGYKNQRYSDFGWAAARLDDVLNWVPARLTAVLIALAHLRPDIAPVVRRDAPLHRSPNAGWPEAAMAACLNLSLAGPRSYDGKVQEFPWVFPEGEKSLTPNHIDRAVTALWKTWALLLILIVVTLVVQGPVPDMLLDIF